MTTYSHLQRQQIDGCGFKTHYINTDTDVRFPTDGTGPPRGLWAVGCVLALSRFLCSVLALPLVTRQSASLGMAVEPGTGQSHTKI